MGFIKPQHRRIWKCQVIYDGEGILLEEPRAILIPFPEKIKELYGPMLNQRSHGLYHLLIVVILLLGIFFSLLPIFSFPFSKKDIQTLHLPTSRLSHEKIRGRIGLGESKILHAQVEAIRVQRHHPNQRITAFSQP